MSSRIRIASMTPAMRPDFEAVHCANGCYCVRWWTDARTPGDNRSFRDALFDRGEYDGCILYLDGGPAGWCQFGPRDRLERLCREYELTPDAGVWAVTCFLVAPLARGLGLSHYLLAGAVEDMMVRGVHAIEAFPVRGPSDAWTGPEQVFVQAGFALERDDPVAPVYRLELVGA